MENNCSLLLTQHSSTAHRTYQTGFGLVEIMVALAIGMFTVLVIMQALAGSEAQRRQATGGSDANTSGSIALQGIQRDLMAAGAGMTGDGHNIFNLCYANGVNAYNKVPTPRDITFPVQSFAPVSIWTNATAPDYLMPASGFDSDTDIIQVISGGSNLFFGRGITVNSWPESLAMPHPSTTDPDWNPFSGLHSGDLTIAVEAGHTCVISQITSVYNLGANVAGEIACGGAPAATVTSAAQLSHSADTAFKNFYTGCASDGVSSWNKTASPTLGVAFTNSQLYSLGAPERLVIRAYGIINGQLVACAPMYLDCKKNENWQVYGDGIISLRAQYGYDSNNDQTIAAGEWVRTLPATPVWGLIKAVRIALVARSKQLQRDPIAGADCAPIWSGYDTTTDTTCSAGATDGQIYLATGHDGANWNRYRVKVFETTVQTRNLFWNN